MRCQLWLYMAFGENCCVNYIADCEMEMACFELFLLY